MDRRVSGVAFAIGAALFASAHIGSSNAYFEGPAGPYPLRVIVRTPDVIPGLAQISVRVTDGPQPALVTVQPLRWDAGLEGAPPPDTARAVPGEAGLWAAELWLMTTGSYGVRVGVAGDDGQGIAFVPVSAVAARRLDMNPLMAAVLVAAALFLFVGGVTIFGAAVRESVLEPGQKPDRVRLRRGRIAMTLGGTALAAILWGGWSWWDEVDAAYRAGIFRPLSTTVTTGETDAGPTLTLVIDDPTWLGRQWTPLVPDHGKLMHMFLVREGDLAAFAHIHPERLDSSTFVVPVPPMRSGRYLVYADIVQESGFTQTLIDTVSIEAWPGEGSVESDGDDSWAELPPFGQSTGERFILPSGRGVLWETGARPRADQEVSLGFRVTEPEGAPARLEPYIGMLSHAVVTRDDGSVFMHIHPAGSINMAAQDMFRLAEAVPGGSIGRPAGARAAPPGSVSFPFVFPSGGSYRVVVQVKVDGAVETAAFDVDVPDA